MSSKNKKKKDDTTTVPREFTVNIMDLAKFKSLASKHFGPNGAKYSFEHDGGFLSIEFYLANSFDKNQGTYKAAPHVSIRVGKGKSEEENGRLVFRGNVWDVPTSYNVTQDDGISHLDNPIEPDPDDDEDNDDDDALEDDDGFRPITRIAAANAPNREWHNTPPVTVTADDFREALARIIEAPEAPGANVAAPNVTTGVRVATDDDHLTDAVAWVNGINNEPRDL